MWRIAIIISVNILIWRVAIVEYSPMATFVNGVEQIYPMLNGRGPWRQKLGICNPLPACMLANSVLPSDILTHKSMYENTHQCT